MRFVLLLAATLLPSALGAQVADTMRLRWVQNPREAHGGWVSDPARHLRPATVAAINKTIHDLERETGAELAVVVLDSLDGLEPADAAQLLHRRWGVGKRARDNGIVLLWSPAKRKIYVSVGYGLEGVLPDARAGRIQDEAILPAFRRANFDAGIVSGVEALSAAAREESYSGLARSAAARPTRDGERGSIPAAIIFAAMFIPVLALVLMFRRHHPRRCPQGHGLMRRLSESDDDVALAREERMEERLGSIDYDVWACAECEERIVIPYRRWLTKFQVCPKCKRRTCVSSSKQLKAATYSSTGLREIRRKCKNCDFQDRREEAIPVLTRSTSSGSSGGSSGGGGSSFGGGSSGGGGAGRSY